MLELQPSTCRGHTARIQIGVCHRRGTAVKGPVKGPSRFLRGAFEGANFEASKQARAYKRPTPSLEGRLLRGIYSTLCAVRFFFRLCAAAPIILFVARGTRYWLLSLSSSARP